MSENTKPIFHAKCINDSSRLKIVYAGSVEENQPIADLDMELMTTEEMAKEYGKNVFFVKKYKFYDIFAKVMLCSISGGHLAKFDKIPCFYLALLYKSEKIGKGGTILNYSLNFVINNKQLEAISLNKPKEDKKNKKQKKDNLEESAEQVEEPIDSIHERKIDVDLKKLINNELSGDYNLLLNCDHEEREEFLKSKGEQIGIKFMEKDDPSFNQEEHDKKQLLFSEYHMLFAPTKLENYVSKNYIIYNKLLKVLKDDKMMEFVDYIMETRYKKTMKDHEYIFDSKIPNKIFNYRDLKDNPDLIDQMLDDDRSSNNSDSDEE